jgi:hypothetical protein
MSLKKAETFFEKFPESPYSDDLAKTIVEWCRTSNSNEMMDYSLKILPKTTNEYKILQDIIQQKKEQVK